MITQNCSIQRTADDTLFWTNIDQSYSGYKNNVRCTFNLLVFPNTEVIATVSNLFLEDYVDVVRYYDDDNSTVIFLGDVTILPHSGGSIKQVLWEFLSDGNMVSTGFAINFIFIGTTLLYQVLKNCKWVFF